MTTATAAERHRSLEKIKAHNQRRIEGLQSRIADRKRVGLPHADLESELKQAQAIASRQEQRAEELLREAEMQEAALAKTEAARIAKAAADIDLWRKQRAERLWVAHGGNPDEFAKAWPTIWEGLLRQAIIQESLHQDQQQGRVNPTL